MSMRLQKCGLYIYRHEQGKGLDHEKEETKKNKPLYAFHIDNTMELVCDAIDHYMVTETPHGKRYRFQYNNVTKTKTERQLDRALNGYVYTFDPDRLRIMELLKKKAESDMVMAYKQYRAAQDRLSEIDEMIEEEYGQR